MAFEMPEMRLISKDQLIDSYNRGAAIALDEARNAIAGWKEHGARKEELPGLGVAIRMLETILRKFDPGAGFGPASKRKDK